MSDIVILAESGSDVPKSLAEELGIYIVPMYVAFGENTKPDGSFPAEEVVTFYQETKILPSTSAANPYDFEAAFDKIEKEHPGCKILYLAYSAVTTCSYANGMIAKGDRTNIYPVDTKQVSVGQCAVVTLMAKYLKDHPECTIEEAVTYAEIIREKVHMCFAPDTLEFLRAGGRVSNGAALIGGLLKIHPLIEILDGYLKATQKFRGSMKKVAPQLIDNYMQNIDFDPENIWLIDTPFLSSEIREIAEETARKNGAKSFTWVKTGGVISSHGGPGAFGIVLLEK